MGPDGAKGTEPRRFKIRVDEKTTYTAQVAGPLLPLNETVEVVEQQPPTEGRTVTARALWEALKEWQRSAVEPNRPGTYTQAPTFWECEQIVEKLLPPEAPEPTEGKAEPFDHDQARDTYSLYRQALKENAELAVRVEQLEAGAAGYVPVEAVVEWLRTKCVSAQATAIADFIAREFGAERAGGDT